MESTTEALLRFGHLQGRVELSGPIAHDQKINILGFIPLEQLESPPIQARHDILPCKTGLAPLHVALLNYLSGRTLEGALPGQRDLQASPCAALVSLGAAEYG